MKESCFSAVYPVSGWNQCVKCVAPLSTAHSFMAIATASAIVMSRGRPFSIVPSKLRQMFFGSRLFIRSRPKEFSPQKRSMFIGSKADFDDPLNLVAARRLYCVCTLLFIVGCGWSREHKRQVPPWRVAGSTGTVSDSLNVLSKMLVDVPLTPGSA